MTTRRLARCRCCLFLLGLLVFGARGGSQPLPHDRGAAGTWQKLLKLQTTASAMHTTAHPDDEHGGMLTRLSRGEGARVSLLTLNRGESGDNAIGSELFDGLGLIRTEELLVADRYYGVDAQYFTTVIDYGFSKRLDEALGKWGREHVLRDVVRVVRRDRPFVLVARFQGNQRDGHGNHQTAGLITQDAFTAAGDPAMFPEQVAEGLRPWQPLKLYMGGMREEEDWTIKIDPGEYSPWLGDSYQTFSRVGLSFQRSQNSGRLNATPGPSPSYYKRLASLVAAPDKERSFFDGIDTTLSGMFSALRRPAPPVAAAALGAIEREIQRAVEAFTVRDPSASVPALARGLAATRAAIEQVAAEPDAAFLLRVKERQFMDAINTALGIEFTATAQPEGATEAAGSFAVFAPPPVMGPVVPGQRFEVRASLTNRGSLDIEPGDIALTTPAGWEVRTDSAAFAALKYNETALRTFAITVPEQAPPSRPYFHRTSIAENRYAIADPKALHHPAAEPVVVATARYSVAGVRVDVRDTVRRREANLPYGYEMRELAVVPAIAISLTPRQVIAPIARTNKTLALQVELVHNRDRETVGDLVLKLPGGWKSNPASRTFRFSRSGEKAISRFTVSVPALESRTYEIHAVARAEGKEFHEGYQLIEHRDLETRYLYRNATSQVRGIDVKVAPNLSVGYIMGVGDDVPRGIAQLGASVQLLGEADLATGTLRQFDAIVTGTRAYAVREDLKTYNQRLLDYVKGGGNLIVLYNTQEFVPKQYAPFPAELPQRAEEVSEEDSPVEILAPDHPVFHFPNSIAKADFDGWVEQRGSKFLTEWDNAYTAMIATYDKGQAPQRGGWVWAPYGTGHYTYFAYAFHRQLPYGVPGAYRLLANLLSMGKARKAAGSGA